MEAKKKLGRGLEEVSHLFLSRQSSPEKETDFSPEKSAAAADPGQALSGSEKRTIVFFSSPTLFTEKSFLACNLALELVKRDFSVGIIETDTRIPNTFFLLGSLVSPAAGAASSSAAEPERGLPLATSGLEPGKLREVLLGEGKKLKVVFLPREEFSAPDSGPVLSGLTGEFDFLIVNFPSEPPPPNGVVSPERTSLIIPTVVNSRELLGCYSSLRKLPQELTGGRIGLLMMKEDVSARAEAAFKLIAEMAARFLSLKVNFLGRIPSGVDFSRSILARTPIILEKEDYPLAESIRVLADDLLEKTPLPDKLTSQGKTSSRGME